MRRRLRTLFVIFVLVAIVTLLVLYAATRQLDNTMICYGFGEVTTCVPLRE